MGRVITSRDNAVIKALRALVGDPREIRRQGRTVIDGPHLLESYRRRMGAPAMIVVGEKRKYGAVPGIGEHHALPKAQPVRKSS